MKCLMVQDKERVHKAKLQECFFSFEKEIDKLFSIHKSIIHKVKINDLPAEFYLQHGIFNFSYMNYFICIKNIFCNQNIYKIN